MLQSDLTSVTNQYLVSLILLRGSSSQTSNLTLILQYKIHTRDAGYASVFFGLANIIQLRDFSAWLIRRCLEPVERLA